MAAVGLCAEEEEEEEEATRGRERKTRLPGAIGLPPTYPLSIQRRWRGKNVPRK